MHIGWAITTVGCFGSVREIVEMSNALVRRGHDVAIYHPTGEPVTWLPSLAHTASLERAQSDALDILIVFPEWTDPTLLRVLAASKATVKACVLAGPDPNTEITAQLSGDETPSGPDITRLRDAMFGKGYWFLPDSEWQADWVRDEIGYANVGPGWGGVNLEQFHRVIVRRAEKPLRILWSNDPRERKASGVVREAIDAVLADTPDVVEESYWGKRIPQDKFAEWLSAGDVWVDGHRRAGWCNPVAEAMACRLPVVCTDIRASLILAEHEVTALVVPVDDVEAMAAAIRRMLSDKGLRDKLAAAARAKVGWYCYDLVAVRLEKAIQEKVTEACA
jgi:hypothetical protein